MNSLINFKVKNFRSFCEETVFSMQATSNKEFAELNTFVCKDKLLPKNDNELLKLAVIFGANASGKTNIVKALDYMRGIVLTSSANSPHPLVQNNTPFAFLNSSKDEPTLFEIEIISKDIFYNYGFEITNKKISKEFLYKRTNIRINKVFTRKDEEVTINSSSNIQFKKAKISNQNLFVSFANTPFLSIDNEIINDLKNVLTWFSEPNLFIINDNIVNKYQIYQEENGKYAKLALEFIKQADIGIKDFSVVQQKIENNDDSVFKILGNHPPQFFPVEQDILGLDLKTKFNVFDSNHNIVGEKEVLLERDFGFHSDGTYRLLSILGLVLKILDTGGIIVIDEIDSKLNFLIVDFIFKSFNSINKNLNNSQLITTAHNVLLMDDDLRRDQIYFTSKNDMGSTELYSLSDFNDVRKSDLFSKKYLAGFYSAIPNLKGVE